jgi:hypothetical protein
MSDPNVSLPPKLGSQVASPAKLGVATLALFLVWGNSFIAVGYLLGREAGQP